MLARAAGRGNRRRHRRRLVQIKDDAKSLKFDGTRHDHSPLSFQARSCARSVMASRMDSGRLLRIIFGPLVGGFERLEMRRFLRLLAKVPRMRGQ